MSTHPAKPRLLRTPAIRLVLAFCALAFVLAGCSGSGSDGANADPPPTGVPAGAKPIETIEFGAEAASGGSSEGTLTALSCADGVLLVATEAHEVHAELSCDRMPPEDTIAAYIDEAAKITLVPADESLGCLEDEPCGKLFVRSDAGGSLEFTVGRAWLSDR